MTPPSLEHALFPKVIRLGGLLVVERHGLEHAPFPKVIRYGNGTRLATTGLEHAPFPKVIRFREAPYALAEQS